MAVKNFPRGGKKPIKSLTNNILSKREKITNKNEKQIISKGIVQKDEFIVSNSAQNLRLMNLQEGMKVLGCIFKVTDYYAVISLPGQISAKLQATDISETYTNLLKSIANNEEVSDEFKPMSNLYQAGEYIVCYIKELDLDSKKILVSIEPQLVNENFNPDNLVKYSKVVVTVSSVEDHGYVLETGVNKFRAFLSVKDVQDANTKYYTGKQIICAVKDIEISENIYTAKVSMKSKHLDNVETNISSIDAMVPGAQYSLIVNKVLKDGLQVSFGENNIGYINQLYLQSSLSLFERGKELAGSLLYILPGLKFSFFSLIQHVPEKKSLAVGDIISKAKVLSQDAAGILMHLKKNIKGYIPFKRTEVEFDKIKSIFIPDSIHKCKIIAYDMIAKLYICSMEKKILEEEYISSANLQIGQVIKATIDKIDKNGYITVKIGKIVATVSPDEISDPGSICKLKIGQIVQARILYATPEKVWITLKKSLIDSKLPILSNFEEAKVDSIHDGTVIKITDRGVLIRFFNNVKDWIPKHFLDLQKASVNWNITLGQTITTVIKKINKENNKIVLAPMKNNKKMKPTVFNIGETVEGAATDSSVYGVNVLLRKNDEEMVAFLPASHMSPCPEVGKMLSTKIVAGDKISAVVFSNNPKIILSTIFAPEKPYRLEDLNNGDLIVCSIEKIYKDFVKVLLPITNSAKYGVISKSNFDNLDSIYLNQIFFGKIIKIDKKTGDIQLTAELTKVWKCVSEHEVKMMTSVDVLSCHLNKLNELSKNIYYSNIKISKINLGQKINGVVEKVMDSGLVLKLEGDVKGIVRSEHCLKKCKEGDQVKGSVLWINHLHEYIEVTLLPKFMKSINQSQNSLEKLPMGNLMRGEIVLVTNWFVLAVLKGQGMGTLVTLPVRRHLNDTLPILTTFQIGNKIRCYGVLNKDECNILAPIFLFKSAFELHYSDAEITNISKSLKRKSLDSEKIDNNSKKKLKKDKLEGKLNNDLQTVTSKRKNQEIETTKKLTQKDDKNIRVKDICKLDSKKRKIREIMTESEDSKDNEQDQTQSKIKNIENEKTKNLNLVMPEIGFKWNNIEEQPTDSSSDDEEVEETEKTIKKKKMSSAEMREHERQKEREIREKEESLANFQIPQTADHFDRLVLSSPDNSLIWIQYMTYHLQAVDIEKARSVAKKALKTINFKEEDEKLNVWQAWLNLESRFGSPESLQEVFEEALKLNDTEKVYSHMLNVHIDASRPAEIQKIVSTMTAKFKFNPETWIKCATAFYKIGLKEKSRHLLERALKALPENKHVEIIIRFAQLENKLGDKERSQTLFEQILTSYPKRTDVWSAYVDSLIKSDQIDIARKVLERAVTQPLPVKKMKTIFKKYLNFEEKHGTPENVNRVKNLAVKYVEKHSDKTY